MLTVIAQATMGCTKDLMRDSEVTTVLVIPVNLQVEAYHTG